MNTRTPTVSELVRRSVEICDPDGVDPDLGRFEQQFEDDDEPVTAVENLEERLAWASEGVDYEIEKPAVSMANALVLYLASKRDHGEHERDPRELMRLAARSEWHGNPPSTIAGWLSDRGVRV